jgi:hypothetical protein
VISEYTARICGHLCAEQAAEMEIERLARKADIMRSRALTAEERETDEAARGKAMALLDIALASPKEATSPAPRVTDKQKCLTLDLFDELKRDDRTTAFIRKNEVREAARRRL